VGRVEDRDGVLKQVVDDVLVPVERFQVATLTRLRNASPRAPGSIISSLQTDRNGPSGRYKCPTLGCRRGLAQVVRDPDVGIHPSLGSLLLDLLYQSIAVD
jgi:hypothetical protein